MLANVLFYLMAASAVGFAVRVILAKNPMVCVLSLLGTFVSLAAIYLLAGFQFMAAAQVLVYVGAVMVLFLFVIMLLNLDDVRQLAEDPAGTLGPRRLGLALAAVGALGLALLFAVGTPGSAGAGADEAHFVETGYDSMVGLATAMFSRYALAFQGAAGLLLSTMVGVMVLAKRRRTTAGESPQNTPPPPSA